jgi:hypothetical protein
VRRSLARSAGSPGGHTSEIRDVVGLYLAPPDNAVVVCVDEKSQVQVQALERTAAPLPLRPMASAYHPGQRRDWIKIKNVRLQDVVISGWKPGQGRRADTIGSLLVGVWDGPRLRYAGACRHRLHSAT